MRLKEWYSWHFPELAKIVTDNITYAQMVNLIGMRQTVKTLELDVMTEIVPEEIAQEIKEAAEISMGTDILNEDEMHIKTLAVSVFEISQYR
jgi:nucleolar protein 58